MIAGGWWADGILSKEFAQLPEDIYCVWKSELYVGAIYSCVREL